MVRSALGRSGLSPEESRRISPLQHTLLMPEDLSIETAEGEDPYLAWSRVNECPLSPNDTVQCVWDFLNLADSDIVSTERFLRKWGLPYIPEAETYAEDWEDWLTAARDARSAILMIAATEAEELVDDDVLMDLRSWDDFDTGAMEDWVKRREVNSFVEYHQLTIERSKEHWDIERRSGRGLELQRKLISAFVNGAEDIWPWVGQLNFTLAWDDAGRRVNGGAFGVQAIVGSYIVAVLSAPEIDVFICSVCRNPFPYVEAHGVRRPAAGKRRLCGEECRKVARQSDNRASWHRNKSRWRPASA
jgi:hypothetical protein